MQHVLALRVSCTVRCHVRQLYQDGEMGKNGRVSFSFHQFELVIAHHVLYSRLIKLSFLQLDQLRKLEKSSPFEKQAGTCYSEAEPAHPPC